VPALAVEAGQELLQRLRRPPGPRPPEHERRIRHDAVEPGREARLAAERRQVAVDLEEGVLHRVLRVAVAPGETTGEAKDTGLISRHQRLEGRVVPGRGPRRQRLVARLHAGDGHADEV
jgi:hypothetical protein